MSETIYFNGKRYDSIADMPADIRQIYERFNRLFADADQDGVPDLIQGRGLAGIKDTISAAKELGQMSSQAGWTQEQLSIVRVTDTGIHVNGKSYNSVEEMPTHVRKVYEQVVNSAQEGGYDIYEEPWREVDRDEYFKPHDDEILNRQIRRKKTPFNPPIETVDSNSRFFLIMAGALVLLCSLVVFWFLFLG